MIDAKSVFGIAADGSDETAKVAAAFAASMTEGVYFGPGVYGTTGVPTFSQAPMAHMEGPAHTVFKNLSADNRLFEFQKQITADLKTSFASFGGFQIDQNGSVGAGIKMGAQYSNLQDIWFRNQGGAGFALDLNGPTLGQFSRLHFTRCNNGLRAINCYYPRFEQISIERLNGYGMLLQNCAAVMGDGVYLDHGPGGTIGSAPELLKIENCFTVDIANLTSEIADAASLSVPAYFKAANSGNINIRGGRVNHSANHGSKYIFYAGASPIVLQGMEWQEERSAIVLLGGSGRMTVRDIVAGGVVSGSGSRYSIVSDGAAERIEIQNWRDEGTPSNHAYATSPARYVNL